MSNKFKNFYTRSITPPKVTDITLFPNTEHVFESEEVGKVLFPICSINLGLLKEEWKDEIIHLVQYHEDAYHPDCTKYFNEYTKHQMISFKLVDNKYKLHTDLHYFDLREESKEPFELTKEVYEKAKKEFKIRQMTSYIDRIKLGGRPRWWQSNETPLDPDGKKMTFITEYETRLLGDDFFDKKIFLFYSHQHKLAVQLYQTT